ncbi:MAG TPA: N-6 DNA methylase [Chloroflexota bacterium]
MGRASTTEAVLIGPAAVTPVTRLIVTPRAEVDELCRLTLQRYLRQALGEESAVCDWLAREGLQVGSAFDRRACVHVRDALDEVRVLDPACGEGHMLVGMLDLLDHLGGHVARALGSSETSAARRRRIAEINLYGVEAQPEVLTRARTTLLSAVVADQDGEFRPGLRCNLLHGDTLMEQDGFRRSREFSAVMAGGGFHLVIGNPPYVRHEQIADPLGRLPRAEYKRRIKRELQRRFPELFATGSSHFDGRADLCVYFTLLGMSFLRSGGVIGYVLPTALFTARYAETVWRFLETTGRTGMIVENLERRSFLEAGVNTALFFAWEASDSASDLEQPVHVSTDGWTTRRVDPGMVRSAAMSANPSSLYRLLDQIERRAVPLTSLGRVRYPIKTGLNRFFYPDPDTVARFAIEPDFLRPVLKSPREVRTILVSEQDATSVLFHCPYSLAELEALDARGAIAYISWGARQAGPVRGAEKPALSWPEVPSLRSRTPWYAVPIPDIAHILCPRFIDRRFFFAVPETGIVEDQTFYGLVLDEAQASRRDAVVAFLNSSLAYLLMETHGRTGLGDGVRQYALGDMAALPVPYAFEVDDSIERELGAAFRQVAGRPIKPIEEEVQQEDRGRLDGLVCAALGLDERHAGAARDAVPALVQARLQRARRR